MDILENIDTLHGHQLQDYLWSEGLLPTIEEYSTPIIDADYYLTVVPQGQQGARIQELLEKYIDGDYFTEYAMIGLLERIRNQVYDDILTDIAMAQNIRRKLCNPKVYCMDYSTGRLSRPIRLSDLLDIVTIEVRGYTYPDNYCILDRHGELRGRSLGDTFETVEIVGAEPFRDRCQEMYTQYYAQKAFSK